MFCYYCGQETFDGVPPECFDHGPLWALWRNVPCADAVVQDKYGRVLLGLRNTEPFRDWWSIPGGHQDLGEHPEHTAKREVLEEFGIHVSIERLLGVTLEQISKSDHRQIVVYLATPVKPNSRFEINFEFQLGGWFLLDDLPEPLTPHAVESLDFLRKGR